ncbi:uncharacterized protein LOC130589424 [Beta vulgaris subsp. vulgaris]|uniref:uncharacterized protein LOC130589424 n=1 Tax=Beta vulgaris subsp. vulgaris TaxID=3555 RepID=UPI002546E5B9|nr:uncharacterized protein LOC130589424 [Beta vulgaris subsp. vulgaris]
MLVFMEMERKVEIMRKNRRKMIIRRLAMLMDCGLQGDKEEGGNKDLDAGVHTEGEKGGNVEKEQPKEADRKRRNADDDQVKGAKDKDKCKISTHVPTRTAAGIDIVDLRTPTPPPAPPPVVEAVENVYSRKSWRVDSSAKRKNIADFDALHSNY